MKPLQQDHSVYGLRWCEGRSGEVKLWVNCLFLLLPVVTSFSILIAFAFIRNTNLVHYSPIILFIIYPLIAFVEFIVGIIVWLRSHSRTRKSAALSLVFSWFLIFTFLFFPYSAPLSCVLVIVFLIFEQKISQFKR